MFWMCLQSNDMANQPLEVTGIKLDDLNDDCLLEIFRSKTIGLYDICSLADTCKRFRQIVQWIAPKELEFREGYSKDDHYDIRQRITEDMFKLVKWETIHFDTTKRILENFGPNLVSVSIWYRKENLNCHVSDQVALNCKESLKHLSLQYQAFDQCQAINMQTIFKKLRSLKFFSVHLSVDAKLFAGMDSLVELKLAFVNSGAAILENTFPKLEIFQYIKEIEMRKREPHESMNVMSAFIARHHNLKYLDFSGQISEKSALMLCQTVVDNCKELHTLGLRCDTTRTTDCIKVLVQSKSLKSLYVEHQSYSHLEVFSTMKELRRLNLLNCGVPLDLNEFESLAHLTKMYLSTPDDFRSLDVVGVIRRL